MLYTDDDTDQAHDKDPKKLEEKIQFEADCSTAWVADNKLICSGEKTNLLVVATTAMRKSRLANTKLEITVCGKKLKSQTVRKFIEFL